LEQATILLRLSEKHRRAARLRRRKRPKSSKRARVERATQRRPAHRAPDSGRGRAHRV